MDVYFQGHRRPHVQDAQDFAASGSDDLPRAGHQDPPAGRQARLIHPVGLRRHLELHVLPGDRQLCQSKTAETRKRKQERPVHPPTHQNLWRGKPFNYYPLSPSPVSNCPTNFKVLGIWKSLLSSTNFAGHQITFTQISSSCSQTCIEVKFKIPHKFGPNSQTYNEDRKYLTLPAKS